MLPASLCMIKEYLPLRRLYTSALALLSLSAVAVPAAAGISEQIVNNPGFNDLDFDNVSDGWQTNDARKIAITYGGYYWRSGDVTARLAATGDSPPAYLWQTVSVPDGAVHADLEFRFQARDRAATDPSQVGVHILDGSADALTGTPVVTAYEAAAGGGVPIVYHVNNIALTPGTGRTLTVRLSSYNAIFGVDDLRLFAITPTEIDTSKPYFTAADRAAQGDTLTFAGGSFRPTDGATIDAVILVDAAGGTIDTAGGTASAAQTITGPGTLTVSGGGQLIVHDARTRLHAAGGTLHAAGHLAAVVIDAPATLSGTGTVGQADIRGTLSPGSSPGILAFAGPVTLVAGAVYVAEIDGPLPGTGAGRHDLVTVAGTLAAAGTLRPVFRGIPGAATNSYTPAIGDRFVIIATSDGISGAFDTIAPAGAPPNTRLDALYGATDLALVVTPASYADTGPTANTRAIGAVLDAARPAAGPRLTADAAVYSSLYGLSAAQLPAMLDQLAGAIHPHALSAGLLARDQARQVVSDRAAQTSKAPSAWVAPFAVRSDLDADSTGTGTDAHALGVALGADLPITSTINAGIAVAVARADLDERATGASAAVESYQAYGYASWRGAVDVTVTTGVGTSSYDTHRVVTIDAGAAFDADTRSTDVSASVVVSRALLAAGVTLTPRAEITADHTRRRAYHEDGPAGLALAIERDHETSAAAEIGAEISSALTVHTAEITPSLYLGWNHALTDPVTTSAATFQDRPYQVSTANPGRDALRLTAGVTGALDDGIQLAAGYRATLRRDQEDHAVKATLRLSW